MYPKYNWSVALQIPAIFGNDILLDEKEDMDKFPEGSSFSKGGNEVGEI